MSILRDCPIEYRSVVTLTDPASFIDAFNHLHELMHDSDFELRCSHRDYERLRDVLHSLRYAATDHGDPHE